MLATVVMLRTCLIGNGWKENTICCDAVQFSSKRNAAICEDTRPSENLDSLEKAANINRLNGGNDAESHGVNFGHRKFIEFNGLAREVPLALIHSSTAAIHSGDAM